MPCRVVHCKRDSFNVLIDRTTKWGNPYSSKPSNLAKYFCSTREESVHKYEEYLLGRYDLLDSLPDLINKTLACWCKSPNYPNRLCHGDVLKYYADYLENGGSVENIKSGKVPKFFKD